MEVETQEASQNDNADQAEKREKKKREPEVVNSRAAALGSAPDVKRDVSLPKHNVFFTSFMNPSD